MMKTLIRKELLDNFLSLRFIVSSIIVVLIMLLSTIVLMTDYANVNRAYKQNTRAYFEHAKEKDNYLELMFSGIGADRPPAPLQIFYTGVEKNPNRSTMIFPFFKPRFMGELNINPVFPLFPAVDLLFVVAIVMSLIAFVFSYDAVCGERERGTLKLLMSYSIPRDKVILAKWIGGYLSLIVSYLVGIILCALVVGVNRNVEMDGQEWAAFIMTIFVSLLFIGVMYSVGLFVSVLAKRSSTSISILLFLWVIFVLVIPNSVPFIVDKIKPIDSPSKVMSRIKYKSGNTIDDLLEQTIKAFEDATGITVDQIDFSDMPGQDEEEEEESSGTQQAQAQSPSGGGSGGSGGGSTEGGSKAQMPAGFDAAQLNAVVGEITDSDLRDLQLRGCERWVSDKLKEKMGMTLEQAKKMAKDYGVDVDIDMILRECESRKKELIELKRSGASAEEIAKQSGAQGAAQAAATQQAAQPKAPEPQKEKVSMQEFWSRFMALSDEEKGHFFDRMYSSFIEMNKRNSKVSAEEEERHQVMVDQQVELTKTLSRLSPVSSYIYAVTDLANTGVEREKHLKDYLWRYQGQFLDFLNKKFNMPDSERVHSIFGGSFREPEFNMDDFPRFRYKAMELSKRISIITIDIIVLFAFAFIFFLLAYMSFIKTEIID